MFDTCTTHQMQEYIDHMIINLLRLGLNISNAGDVNGDGLDDLIVGAKHADPDSKSNAGKSYGMPL